LLYLVQLHLKNTSKFCTNRNLYEMELWHACCWLRRASIYQARLL
jgi:hypothetical protein